VTSPVMTDRSWGRAMSAVVGAAAMAIGAWQVVTADDGLRRTALVVDELPVMLLEPATSDADDAVGIVVAHGFAGSRSLMRSWGLALARNGYVVALPDLAGHGANPRALDRRGEADAHLTEVLRAVEVLVEQGGVPPDRIGLLGHSMGSGAVLRAGIAAPQRVAAVVAVSPTDAAVTPTRPRELLLLAGSLEGAFVANAEDLLARAGGATGEPGDAPTARDLQIITGVEHVSILFSPTAHAASIAWLDAAFDRSSPGRDGPALVGWWAVFLAGSLTVWRAGAPSLLGAAVGSRALVARPRDIVSRHGRTSTGWTSTRRDLLGASLGALSATAVLAIVGLVAPIGALGGMAVGPVLALWFGLAGAVWWLIGARPGRLTWADAVGGAVLLGVLVLAFGLLAPAVWLPWFPILGRAVFIPPLAAAIVPWTVMVTAGLRDRRGWAAVGWWAVTSAIMVIGIATAAVSVPGIGFVLLLLPLLPPLLALIVAVTTPWTRAVGTAWAPGLAAAVFLGWTMAVLFPLTSGGMA
jgi:dienelactone hydrolase